MKKQNKLLYLLTRPFARAISNQLSEQIEKDIVKFLPSPDKNRTVQWDYPADFAQIQSVTQQKRKQEGSLSFSVLRNFSVNYPIARACIEYIKNKAVKLEWMVAPANEDVDFNPDDPRVDVVEDFFSQPLGRRSTYREFIEAIIEDYLVIGASSLEVVGTRAGQFANELKLVDASTIRILLNEEGRTPEPPDPAYIQVAGGRIVARLTADELIYEKRQNRTNSVYGLSPLESLILQAESAIKGAKFSLAFFSDGTLPEGFMEMPEGWSQDQIKSFEKYFNALLAGNPFNQRKIKAIPAGSKWTPIKKPDEINFDRFELWLMKQTCSVFGVPPSDIGFEHDVNRSTAESQRAMGQERAMRPISVYLEDMFTNIVQDRFGFRDLAFKFTDVDPVDRKQEAEIDSIRVRDGILSIDEIRNREGLEPIGVNNYIANGKSVVFIDEFKNGVPNRENEMQNNNQNDNMDNEEENDDIEEKSFKHELSLWRKQSIRALKRGNDYKRFKSNTLASWMIEEIYHQLGKCESQQQIKLVFQPYFSNSMRTLKELNKINDTLSTIEANG